jgi:hypothetical protein
MVSPHLPLATGASIRDSDWIRKSFMLSTGDIPPDYAFFSTFSTASMKVTDSSLGGHLCINVPHQFTPFADLRMSSLASNTTDIHGDYTTGIGRSWSEDIDDNLQVINMQFGRPRFRGIIPFFTNFYDAEAATLAREGRGTSIFFSIGKMAGTVALVAAVVAAPAFAGVFLAAKTAAFFLGRPASGYYYMSPTMPVYWDRCNFILNTLAANRGLVPRRFVNGGLINDFDEKHNDPVTEDYVDAAYRLTNGAIFKKGGGMDIYNVANKAARMEHARQNAIEEIGKDATTREDLLARLTTYRKSKMQPAAPEGIESYRNRYFSGPLGNPDYRMYDPVQEKLANTDLAGLPPVPATDGQTTDTNIAQEQKTEQELLDENKASVKTDLRPRWKENDAVAATPTGENASAPTEPPPKYVIEEGFGTSGEKVQSEGGAIARFFSDLLINAQQGADWVSFAVSHQGSVSESFSSSYTQSEIDSTLNGTGASLRSAYFNFSGGQTGFALVDSAISAATEFAKGALTGLQLDGLLGLAGGASVHIPKRYESSSTSFPSNSYTIELRSPYGSPLAQYINLDVPLAMLLAAALPISAGAQAYVEPYLVHLHSRGRSHVRLGAITSLSVTRGVGNLGFNKDGRALGYDITFEIVELSNVMHAPITTGFSITKPWNYIFDDDSTFKDYMGTLANLSLADQTSFLRKIGLNMARANLSVDSYFSASHWSNAMGGVWPIRKLGELATVIGGGVNATLL